MANPGTIKTSNFFGGDKVEQYRQELVADGKIPGTKQNATPDERKEGLRLYRKNKVEFKTFVDNVLKKKSAAGGGSGLGGPGNGGGGLRPTRALLPGTRTGSLIKYRPTVPKEDLKTSSTSKEVTSQQVESGFDDILDKIDDLLKEVRDTSKFERAVADKDRKEKEKDKREQKEIRLEGIKNILAGPAQKILAPIKNVFQEIMDAIGKVLFAKVGVKLIDWYSDEGNQEKLHRVIKFFREHWLLIVGGLLLFGTRLNGLVMFFLRLGLKYVPKLIGLVAKMLAAAGKLALKMGGGALKLLGKAGGKVAPIARAALVSPAAKVIGLGAAAAGTAVLANEVTGQRKAASAQAGNAARARRGQGMGVQGVGGVGDIGPTPSTGSLQGIRGGGLINSGNRTAGPLISFNPTFAFSNGGIPLGTDTIPAMLSPGEFVMSKGAVQQFGVDTLAAMNAAGGGTNRPKLLSGTLYATGGGYAGGHSRDESKKTAPSSGTASPSSSSGGSAIVAAAKNAVRTGKQGPAKPPCASWVRMVLGMAKHPAAKKRTMKGDLDPDGTAYNGENFAASFAGSDMGTVVRSQSSLLPGDIVLHKNTYGSFTPGAITHVSIASDKKGKILHQSTSGGPPKESGIFNFAAAIRLGGKGVIGSYEEGGGDFQASPGSADIASGTSEESVINPIKYMADTYKLYQEVFGTTPSDMQKVNPAIGVPSPQVASATPKSGISNDIPKLGSIDPNNRSTIGMKAMYSIVQ